MGKSVKEKLEEKQKREHRKYRDELLEDFNTLFEDWKAHADRDYSRGIRERNAVRERMEEILEQTKEVSNNIGEVHKIIVQEINQLKGRSHKLFWAWFAASLFGSLIAYFICGYI